MLKSVPREVLQHIFSHLTLSGNGGAIALSCTCKSLRGEVLAYKDFDEFALSRLGSATASYEPRCKAFPVSAKNHASVDRVGEISSLESCTMLHVGHWTVLSQVLADLPRPEILRCLFVTARRGEAYDEFIMMINSERLPNLKILALPVVKFARTLPKSVTTFISDGFDEQDENLDFLAQAFPNLKNFELRDIRPFQFGFVPPTVETLDVAFNAFHYERLETLQHLENLHSLRRLRIRLRSSHREGDIRQLVFDYLPSHVYEFRLSRAFRGNQIFELDTGFMMVTRLMESLTILEVEQPFYLPPPAVKNPFECFPNLRRLDLSVTSRVRTRRSIISCAFETLPKLKDFRIVARGVPLLLNELIRCGQTRPHVRVALSDDTEYSHEETLMTFDTWEGLWSYNGHQFSIFQNLHKFPNLVHLAIHNQSFNWWDLERLPRRLRTIVIKFDWNDSRSFVDFLGKCNDLFALGLELDVVEIATPLSKNVTDRDVARFNSNHEMKSFLQGQTLRRKEGGRSLVARLPPGNTTLLLTASSRPRGHEWYETLGMMPHFLF